MRLHHTFIADWDNEFIYMDEKNKIVGEKSEERIFRLLICCLS